MSDSESATLAHDGDSDISDLLEESLSSDSGKECDRESLVNGRRGRKLGQYVVQNSDCKKKEEFVVWKAFCMRPKPLRCFPGCMFEVLAPELHTEGASGDGPFSDVDDYDENSPEEDNEENTNGDSDKESDSEEGIDKDKSGSDEEEKDWDHIFPVLLFFWI